jgi:hypothetical protein
MRPAELESLFGDTIYSYTQEDAIEDGLLVKADEKLAKEAGFKIPVVLTSSVHEVCNWKGEEDGTGQSYTGRLWDVLTVAALTFRQRLRAAKTPEDEREMRLIPFKVRFLKSAEPLKFEDDELWLVFDESTGFTIMYPEDY